MTSRGWGPALKWVLIVNRIFKAKTWAKGSELKSTNISIVWWKLQDVKVDENIHITIQTYILVQTLFNCSSPQRGKKEEERCFSQICIHVTFLLGPLPSSSTSVFLHVHSWCLRSINLYNAKSFLNFVLNKVNESTCLKSHKDELSEGTTCTQRSVSTT